MNKIEAIRNILESGMMDELDILKMWNDKCRDTENGGAIHENTEEFFYNEFYNINRGIDLMEMARAISQGCYFTSDEYVWRNHDGNVMSGSVNDAINDDIINFEDLAIYISKTNCHSFEEVWSLDLFDSFKEFYRDKYNVKQSDEIIEETFFKEDYNLVLDDWDVIGEALYKKLNQ